LAEHKVALITDTHFGVRKGNQIFHDYFEKFYSEVFFPTLDERGITEVIHLGDCFDVRKGIDYWSLDWAKRVFFDPLRDRGIKLHMIVGNHDIFYKTSLKINAPDLNLAEYDNIIIYDSPSTTLIGGVPIAIFPWICEDNASETYEERDNTRAKIAMGHLELAGFLANQNYMCETGTDPQFFKQFETVFSGHFHKRSTRGNITYLGNAYQMNWNDEGEKRGFSIFDVTTQELEYINNPFPMFHKLYYNESKPKLIKYHTYEHSYVKIIVEDKSTPKKLSHVVDELYRAGVHDVKVIDNMDITLDDDVEVESEDTLTTLSNYVSAMEGNVTDQNKANIVEIFKSLYAEAQEV
jgi:DNA repair exonuclease SbcCD nuclease subunit